MSSASTDPSASASATSTVRGVTCTASITSIACATVNRSLTSGSLMGRGFYPLHKRFDGLEDPLGVQPLVAHLLPEAAGAFLVGADVVVLPLEPVLEQVAAELAADARRHVEPFRDQHEGAGRETLHRVDVVTVERRLVDQANLHAGLVEAQDGVVRAVESFAEGDDVSPASGR